MVNESGYEVVQNGAAFSQLDALHLSSPKRAAELEALVDGILDLLATSPELCQHEPYPSEHGTAFLTWVFDVNGEPTGWYCVWGFSARDPRQIVFARVLPL